MQFKASTDYGLRAVLYLAAQGHTCSSKDIAQDLSIPRDYLIQLAQLLRNAGIIEARPGKHGGYRRSCCGGVSDRTADGLPHSIADQRRRPQIGAFFLRRCARSSIRCWLAL